MRLCFAPKDHDCGYNDDRYLTIAFQRGHVLTMNEFASLWQEYGGEWFLGFDLRTIEIYETCWEMCPHCENEVELPTKWQVHRCPVCGKAIAPCNLCYSDYANCKDCWLSKEIDSINNNY